ncbi:hypothetical protein [Cytobacillus sp. BC1816]
MCRTQRVRLFNLQTEKRTVEQKASKGTNGKDKKIKKAARELLF